MVLIQPRSGLDQILDHPGPWTNPACNEESARRNCLDFSLSARPDWTWSQPFIDSVITLILTLLESTKTHSSASKTIFSSSVSSVTQLIKRRLSVRSSRHSSFN